mgnify:CR=1 FL=1
MAKPKDPVLMNSPEYRTLRKIWNEKLRAVGFKDIEDCRGNLKQHDRRTIGFEHRELISDFFRRVDHYLTAHPEIPSLHRRILSLWSDGVKIKDICKKTRRCSAWVREIIRRYRRLLLGMH